MQRVRLIFLQKKMRRSTPLSIIRIMYSRKPQFTAHTLYIWIYRDALRNKVSGRRG